MTALTRAVIVVVSKGFDTDRIIPLLEEGHRVFGESRVQEAKEKWPALKKQFKDVELHLIGPLQTNKVRKALAVFDCIETLDRIELAKVLRKEMEVSGRIIPCFVQVNTGSEPQKSGVLPEDAGAFISQCRDEFGIIVIGLMCIPPKGDDPAPHFKLLRDIARRNDLSKLSMGMSSDYRYALKHGATHIRVGTAILGERTKESTDKK